MVPDDPARGLVLVCETEPGGFGHAMAHRAAYAMAATGHEVDVRALAEEQPEALGPGDTLVVVHPHWREPPVEVETWLEDLLGPRPDVRRVVALGHSDGPGPAGAGADRLWSWCAAGRHERVARRSFAPVADSPAGVRAGWLEEVDSLIAALAAPRP